MTVRKRDIDEALAAELGLAPKEVRDLTQAFLDKVRDALAEMEEVHLPGFGRLHIASMEGALTVLTNTPGRKTKKKQVLQVHRKFRVHFAKAEPFNRLLRAKHGPGSEKSS